MDDARGLRGLPARLDRPRADFLHARGEVGRKPEETVCGGDELIEAGLLDAEIRQEGFAFGSVEFLHFGLNLRADRDRLGADLLCVFEQAKVVGILHFGTRARRALVDIADEEEGLLGDELKIFDEL